MNGSDHLADLDVDGKIILKWILMKYGVNMCNALNQLRT